MTCTARLFNIEWDRHSWRPEVSSTDYVTVHETNPFGREFAVETVRCQKHQVCEACGTQTADVECFCDKEYGEHCAPRVAYLAQPGK